MIPTTVPAGTSRLTLRTACTPAKAFETPSRASRGSTRVTRGSFVRPDSALRIGRRRIGQRLRGELLRPDQFLFAVDPLEEGALDDAGAVSAELHRPDYRHHVGGGD